MVDISLPQLPDSADTIIVGAGLAGLSAAVRLAAAGQSVVILEASDGVGGRVRTDIVDGFRLDRGFQVLLTSYPEVQRLLDLDALDLRAFTPGAVIWIGRQGYRIGDPFRDRSALIETARSPALSTADKLRVVQLRHKLRRGNAHRLLLGPEQTTAERLASLGFTPQAVTRLLGPLFAGLQLDPELKTSSRMFDIMFRSLSEGSAALPNLGMGQIPAQIAASLPESALRLQARAITVDAGRVELEDGSIRGENVVVATDGPTASTLLSMPDPGSLSVGCLWFEAEIPPLTSRSIVLDGMNRGPVRNLAVMTNVAPGYAPGGSHLIAAACPGDISSGLVSAATAQLRAWFGSQADDWKLLRTDRITHGLPTQSPPLRPRQNVRVRDGLWVCGDHRDTGSIQGAMFSGRRAAEAILGLPAATTGVRS